MKTRETGRGGGRKLEGRDSQEQWPIELKGRGFWCRQAEGLRAGEPLIQNYGAPRSERFSSVPYVFT
ncbi:Hypothetical predicted protein [Marmota monax]|uniref:Uncharacterized protein n=1 Tax=Marmota monax TaxID=9995 RepID=A0A5E4BKX2_MARMO|nr:hypothetical protein GHT09_013892 [Marmota monax]VTJ69302.1 Hypothetical predicted protein [Marmota monax]